ncbi:MAG TPA: MFS transporter [Gammaproteobacteria bacterium]|nr:MFS transporter [Gammaproteobacteria bacterium]
MNQSKSHSIFPLLWVMLFDHTSLNITFPVLTLLFFDVQSSLFAPETSHAVRSMWYGLCVAVPHIMNVVMTPILSGLSDEFGRKRLLMIGTLGAFLFAITAAFGVLYGMLGLVFLGRIIQGAFSRTNPIGQAIIGDISSKEKKVLHMGYLQTAISIGAFIGPIMGGYIANRFLFSTLNFSLPYFLAAFFAAISCLLTVFFFKETLTEKRVRARWSEFNFQSIKKVFSDQKVLRISIILALSQISWSIFYQFIPPTLKTVLNFNAHQLGLFVGLIALWLALATSLGIRFLQRFFTSHQILVLSIYLVLAGSLLTFLFCFLHLTGNWTALIWIAAIPTAVGDVIAYSCLTALYSDVVKKEEQGKVMGMCFIVVALIWAMTGILGGVLMSAYSLLPLIVAPIGIFFTILLLHFDFLKV